MKAPLTVAELVWIVCGPWTLCGLWSGSLFTVYYCHEEIPSFYLQSSQAVGGASGENFKEIFRHSVQQVLVSVDGVDEKLPLTTDFSGNRRLRIVIGEENSKTAQILDVAPEPEQMFNILTRYKLREDIRVNRRQVFIQGKRSYI